MEHLKRGLGTIVFAVVLGAGIFAVGPYFDLCSQRHRTRSRAMDEVMGDSPEHAVKRGAIGGGVGLLIGLYLVYRSRED